MIGQQNARILLVDDEPVIRKLISRYLVGAGCVVRVAEDGLDAIGKLRTGLPDLIISDLKMPRMSGIEFLDVVRKRFPQIPVIAISSIAADELPVGVAADVYCYKNDPGFEPLLQAVSDLTRKPLLRTMPPYIDNQPVQARSISERRYVIGCDDCLREFTFPQAPNTGRHERLAPCTHCGKLVPFLVADEQPRG